MEKLTMVLMLLSSMIITMPMIHKINGEDTKEIEEWFQTIGQKSQKLTKLHFYFHARPNGNNLNQARIAQANMTTTSPTFFGRLNVVDYPLTEGRELTSKLFGRAQGFYASVSTTKRHYFMSVNLIFTDGSSITISGNNAIFAKLRELPIIGGSGAFRLARGVVTLKTYMFDIPSGNATIEVNVLALHY